MIRLHFSNSKKADILCHNGIFHADDVFSSVLLCEVFDRPLRICRTNCIPDNLSANTIVFDIGYGKYDHHQKGGNGVRENGIPYASFGLLWRDYGKEFCKKIGLDPQFGMLEFDRFVEGIDGYDNGLFHEESTPIMNISQCIRQFNPPWEANSIKVENTCFLNAVKFADVVFQNTINGIKSRYHARSELLKELEKTSSDTMILQRFLPYSACPEMKGRINKIIYPSLRGGFNLQIISSEYRLPKSLSGLNSEKLQRITGIPSAGFVSNNGRLCGTGTIEDAHKFLKLIENIKP